MDKFQAPAVISGVKTLVDKTIRLTIDCPELNADSMSALFTLCHKSGWFLFAEEKFNQEDSIDLPPIVLETPEQLSKSERLRRVLHLVWEKTDKQKTSQEYYDYIMEKLIEQYKQKLN